MDGIKIGISKARTNGRTFPFAATVEPKVQSPTATSSYRIKPGFAGGVVNPFYKAPRKRRVIKRHRDGNINVTGTIEAYCNSK